MFLLFWLVRAYRLVILKERMVLHCFAKLRSTVLENLDKKWLFPHCSSFAMQWVTAFRSPTHWSLLTTRCLGEFTILSCRNTRRIVSLSWLQSFKSGQAFRVGFGPKVDKNFGLNSGLRRTFCLRCTKK